MKKPALLLVSLSAVATASTTAEDQAYFAIFAETSVMKIAGMEEVEMPDLPPGVTLPGGLSLPGKPSRKLSVRLWSPSIAPPNATASVAPPAGLKVGPKMDLELYRPTEQENSGKSLTGADQNPEFTIKVYWGSSDKVREGQPRIIKWGGLTPEQKAEMNKRAREAQPGSAASYFYKPNWTTGYWPTKAQPGAVAKDASLVGSYAVTTSYTGNVTLDVPAGVDFLPAFDLSSPKLADGVDFTKPISFAWKPITGSLGAFGSALGAEGKNTMIIWSSAETFNEALFGDFGYLQMAEVRQRVADKLFMPPDQTKVVIPAGIFKDADFAMANFVAYGPGAAADKTQPLPRLQTKSTMQVILGGKEMGTK